MVRLVVFHYHDRPGGVRQVISRGLPLLVPRLGAVTEVVLLMGERTDPVWGRGLASSLAGVPVRTEVHPDFGYLSGRDQKIGSGARALLQKILSGSGVLVWAHNLSVGRNIPLLQHLPEWCAGAGARLWLHHHDWWWDGRWLRWADWQSAGVPELEAALEASLPVGPHIRHGCVNRADLAWVQQRAGTAACWTGNPLPERNQPDGNQVKEASSWLLGKTGGRRVWLVPSRALRRKNLAEAILLARQQDEPTCIVTTGGPASAGEIPGWETLCREALRHGWPLVPAVLAAGAEAGRPSLPSLMAAADAIIMPSLQEGFGLPYLEAAALRKPLLARALPHAMANLAASGCTLPGAYDRVPVHPGVFDISQENARLAGRWGALQIGLPEELRTVMPPRRLTETMDFGCLSAKAQMEVLQSGYRPAPPSLLPQVPVWPDHRQVDTWADRWFAAGVPEGRGADGPGGQGDFPPGGALLPEVLRRFRYWLDHPLLWP